MAISKLDLNTALVVVDLQKGIVAFPTAHPIKPVIKCASRLAAAFRQHGLPVVLVNVAGGAPGRTEQNRQLGNLPEDWADLIPELEQRSTDHTVTKRTWGAFTHSDLATWLKSRDVTQLVLAGVATSIGVESTARDAYELGFNVTLAIDAMTDISAEAHDNSVQRIFPRLGETGSTDDVIAQLDLRVA